MANNVRKTYVSRHSAIALSLTLRDPRRQVRVRFLPLSDGGSIMVTDDRRLQRALESHPRFNKLFCLEEEVALGGDGKDN